MKKKFEDYMTENKNEYEEETIDAVKFKLIEKKPTKPGSYYAVVHMGPTFELIGANNDKQAEDAFDKKFNVRNGKTPEGRYLFKVIQGGQTERLKFGAIDTRGT